MPEIVFIALRYVFLALLYVFLFLVVRVVYREISPATRPLGERAGTRRRQKRRGAMLLIQGGSGRKRQAGWKLENEIVIGRTSDCDISLKDEFTSNMHAKIYRLEGRYYVEDLGSTNGTYVNGRRITYPTELRGGDRVKVGRTVMEFRR